MYMCTELMFLLLSQFFASTKLVLLILLVGGELRIKVSYSEGVMARQAQLDTLLSMYPSARAMDPSNSTIDLPCPQSADHGYDHIDFRM